MTWIDENAAHQAESNKTWEALRGNSWRDYRGDPYAEQERARMFWEAQKKRQVEPPKPDPPKAEPRLEPAKEQKKVRGLFKVYIVDPEFDTLIYEGIHIAADESAAKVRGALKGLADKGELAKDFDDYDVIIQRLGNVRDKAEIQGQNLQSLMLERMTSERRMPKLSERIDEAVKG